MEYYECIVDQLFSRTGSLVEQLERRDSVPFRTRPLNRFIGEAILARNEVLSVLRLLDKPDATWEDAVMDRIYNDLRAEFDLADRYAAMESKLCSIQEAVELVLDVARDHRLLLLEVPGFDSGGVGIGIYRSATSLSKVAWAAAGSSDGARSALG